jgi:nucleoside-diphosphate-sugar epimerase
MSRYLITGGSGFIGTNTVAAALDAGHDVLNLDSGKPLFSPHRKHWRKSDLLDAKSIGAAFADFEPNVVIHLAAVTDCDPQSDLAHYAPNVAGTEHVLDAVRGTPRVDRLIVTSSQFVCRPGYAPKADDDYSPHTVYGESKVLTERATRAADLSCAWSIIRPTNIWGPWLLRHLPFYRLMRRGLYVHPASDCIRTWGYVGTVVDQIFRLLTLPADVVTGKTVYVGDPPRRLTEIANEFSRGLRGREVRQAPQWLLRNGARLGDCLSRIGLPSPLTTARYRSMTEDYIVDMEPTYELLGRPAFSNADGVRAVGEWLDAYGRKSDRWTLPRPASGAFGQSNNRQTGEDSDGEFSTALVPSGESSVLSEAHR